MKQAEAAVLAVLNPGGLLSAAQIQRAAALTGWSTRDALARLEARGLIVPSFPRGRWQVSERGRSVFATKAGRLV
jgi:DNA-binding GntR family transcriptional regulator